MYERAEDLLALAIRMQGSATGVSLDDIEGMFGVGRRTAERMRDAVVRVFGELDTRPSDDRRVRWSLPASRLSLLTLNANELAQLHAAAKLMRRENRPDAARTMEGIEEKIRAAMGSRGLRRVEPDLEALIEAEGMAMRPGPRLQIDASMLTALRTMILKCHKVRIRYRGRQSGTVSRHKVCPYGFLYGTHPYLVAFSLNPRVLDYRTYRLSGVLSVEETEEVFTRDPSFALDAFARRSFGVFQEEPFDVVWKFTPEAAADAREWVFHPAQVMEDQPDGSLIVRFTAGGALEMSWHLYTWGDAVEVLEPEDFWERIR
jgi:predicted DNA-binding transcriptional regulator YafY